MTGTELKKMRLNENLTQHQLAIALKYDTVSSVQRLEALKGEELPRGATARVEIWLLTKEK